jgi:hypothetical protein
MDVEKSRRRLEVRGTALLGLSFQAIGELALYIPDTL